MSVSMIASARLLSADVLTEVATPWASLDSLPTAHVLLRQSWTYDIGIWEASPGTAIDIDVENEEVLLVLAGAGTIIFADGSRIDLRLGVRVHLRAGDRAPLGRSGAVYAGRTCPVCRTGTDPGFLASPLDTMEDIDECLFRADAVQR